MTESNDIESQFRAQILPVLLGCEERHIDVDLLQQRHMLTDPTIKVDLVAALLFYGSINREAAYRELASLPFNVVDDLNPQAQEVVRGAKHVIEDLDDDLGFDLTDGTLEADLKRLHQQCVETYCSRPQA